MIDFFLFCLRFFGTMALTLLILWAIIVVCDWVEDWFRLIMDRYQSRGKY